MSSSSRPVTPNMNSRRSSRRQSRRSSGAYLLSQSPKIHYPVDVNQMPLESAANTEKFERLSDSLEELDANMNNLSSIHDAISNQFNEPFASFLYGISMTMWCVDFPGCPTRQAWERLQKRNEIDKTIRELNTRVSQAKEENESLKKKLVEISKPEPLKRPQLSQSQPKANLQQSQFQSSSRAYRGTRAPRVPSTLQRGRVNDEDSYASTEGSFVANPSTAGVNPTANAPSRLRNSRFSRIPQPAKTANRSTSPEITVTSTKRTTGPNLDQPPRYMRGLFDSSNTTKHTSSTTSSRSGAISKRQPGKSTLAARPRFR
ncbi:predicted protein [Scheffersomyces stipitis CBS 6054]|uniref:DASH complex subunit DAM1 n=1 Tax=Scheffersomyces stipitis (strain ATCC 58785 / CBS 6054 / NBRC 10063 / NRRL Y-11545) TaxID=322104 RepID=A3LPT1_PICST|nr:predicted protein [Scheffersomyces stipitis CBS 6054]ABN64551.2 predicted protein [Scheffersomyces stipitis CBS 6054]KAG2736461.1 hypothetical protein G9P44_000551 [Scheffersomyces stipitis]